MATKKSVKPTAAKETQLAYSKPVEESPKFYANNVRISSNVFDIRFIFGLFVENTEDLVTIEPQVVLHMSPQHAKSVAELLNRQLAEYEEKYGAIPEVPT
jgi:hypothetical protein